MLAFTLVPPGDGLLLEPPKLPAPPNKLDKRLLGSGVVGVLCLGLLVPRGLARLLLSRFSILFFFLVKNESAADFLLLLLESLLLLLFPVLVLLLLSACCATVGDSDLCDNSSSDDNRESDDEGNFSRLIDRWCLSMGPPIPLVLDGGDGLGGRAASALCMRVSFLDTDGGEN